MRAKNLLFLLLLTFLLTAWSGCATQSEVRRKQSQAVDMEKKGNEFFQQGQYLRSLGYYQRALQGYESIDLREGVARSLTGMGSAFQAMGRIPTALEYYQRSLAIHSDLGNDA
ncbi:MAG: tetratricopeptide repeat protein, partial [Deltaproteobacteria bacterium]|nr:tetratricopeptide repeat protein [Deltaproteobacteria bacterium]